MLALLLCLCYDAYHLLIMPPKLPCQTSNPPCPSKPLIGYVTALLNPLIALLVAGEVWRSFLVGTFVYCWDITILSYYLNASIYLVKGGRLGLLPSVLFHSCRPSFRHTGVMFLDFVFLTWLGYNWYPLTVCLE